MLVTAARPGTWLMRCDNQGKVVQQIAQDDSSLLRFCGHAIVVRDRLLLTTETDHATGRGRIGVRDLQTLKKIDDWDTHGIDPHQLLLDGEGHLIPASACAISHGAMRRPMAMPASASPSRPSTTGQRIARRHPSWLFSTATGCSPRRGPTTTSAMQATSRPPGAAASYCPATRSASRNCGIRRQPTG